MWLPEDTQAALEWQAHRQSLCPGCRLPIFETTAEPPPDWPWTRGHWEDRYDVEAVTCAACAARERRSRRDHHSAGQAPPAGRYYIVMLGEEGR